MPFFSLFNLIFRGSKGLSKAALNLEPVDEDTLRERKNQCASCGQATRTKGTHLEGVRVLTPMSSCSLCKCAISAKTKVAGEACPIGKW